MGAEHAVLAGVSSARVEASPRRASRGDCARSALRRRGPSGRTPSARRPAGDPAWFVNAFFRTDAGSNHARLASDDVDAKLDVLDGLGDHAERVAATADIQAAIQAEMAVSNLVTPAWHVGPSRRGTVNR